MVHSDKKVVIEVEVEVGAYRQSQLGAGRKRQLLRVDMDTIAAVAMGVQEVWGLR
jgi:hypothetical protein